MTTKQRAIEELPHVFEAGAIVSASRKAAIDFNELIVELAGIQVIFVGEQHTDPAHHKIQLDVIKAIHQRHPRMRVGMEMFDHTYQDILDSWSAGLLDQQTFLEKVHWYANWRFNYELYREILEYIRQNNIPLIGLNLPTHIPPKIRVGGIDNLSPTERALLPASIDTSNKEHRAYVEKIYQRHHARIKGNFEYFYQAQCVWEDTMAESIARNLSGEVMVVLAGNGHIVRKFGIPERVYHRTGLPYRTIYPTAKGQTVQLSAGDYIWITTDK